MSIYLYIFTMALTTYPIYRKILNRRKKKYAGEILALREKIMKD